MSALYLLMQRNKPVAEASKQLSFRYLHIKQAKTGLLDAFLCLYLEAEGMAFFDWVNTMYDPKTLQAEFCLHPGQTGWLTSCLSGSELGVKKKIAARINGHTDRFCPIMTDVCLFLQHGLCPSQ